MVWALNCQPLRVVFAIAAVTIAALLSGVIAVHSLQGMGKVPVMKVSLSARRHQSQLC